MSLQLISPDVSALWFTLNAVVIVFLSLLIAYQAIRGFLRSGRRPMLFLAIGVMLLTVVPLVVMIIGARLFGVETVRIIVSPLANSVRAIGLVSIVYSLYSQG